MTEGIFGLPGEGGVPAGLKVKPPTNPPLGNTYEWFEDCFHGAVRVKNDTLLRSLIVRNGFPYKEHIAELTEDDKRWIEEVLYGC